MGCVMSQSLFNISMDGVEREVNATALGRGLERLQVNGGRFELNQLLFEDDKTLLADSEKLCRPLTEFRRACEKIKLRVNVGKSKI